MARDKERLIDLLARKDYVPSTVEELSTRLRLAPHQRAELENVLEHKRNRLVGTLKRSPRFLYVIPDDPRVPHDIYVPEPKDVGRPAREGDKVVVELRDWESRHTNPEGEVIEVLGPADAEGVDLL